MTTDAGALLVTPAKDGSRFYWEAVWRQNHTRYKRRLGVAWVLPRPAPGDADGWQRKYRKRPGRPGEGALTAQQATVAMRELIAEVAATVPRRGAVTFATAAVTWLDEPHGWKPATERDYRSMLSKTAPLHVFADERVDKITAADVDKFLRSLKRPAGKPDAKDKRPDPVPAAPRTVNKYRRVLSMIFDLAVEKGWRKDNPCADVKIRKAPDAAELIVYSVADIAAIEREAENHETVPYLGALIVVAATCGLRRGELLALRWRDVRFTESVLKVSRSMSAGEEGAPKSGKARTVPLSAWPAEVLTEMKKRDERTGPNDLVFGRADGSHLDGDVVSTQYRQARDAVAARDPDLPPLRFHDLRHTFGTLLAAEGYAVTAIQSYMGHADLATTAIYMHWAPQADAAARMSAIFKRPELPAAEPVGAGH